MGQNMSMIMHRVLIQVYWEDIITLYEEEIKHSLTYVHYWLHTLKSLEKNKIEVKKYFIYNKKISLFLLYFWSNKCSFGLFRIFGLNLKFYRLILQSPFEAVLLEFMDFSGGTRISRDLLNVYLFFKNEHKSYEFGTTWRWVIYHRFFR